MTTTEESPGARVPQDEWLWGWDPTPGIVSVWAEPDGRAIVWRRIAGTGALVREDERYRPCWREVTCAPLREQAGARVLIGGLGLGFTLRAALRSLALDADVVVVEIVEEVIRWNRNPDYALAADALADPRVDLRHDDVANVLAASPGAFDAIMLDVDNGAAPLTTQGNAVLYRAQGIRRAAAALRPDGRLACWLAGVTRSSRRPCSARG